MKLNDFIIPRDRHGSLNPSYWNGIVQTGPDARRLNGVAFHRYYIVVIKQQMLTVIYRSEWEKSSRYVGDRLYASKAYWNKIQRAVERRRVEVELFLSKERSKKVGSKLSIPEIIEQAERVKDLWVQYDQANVPAWFIGGDRFSQLVEQEINAPDDVFKRLSLPLVPSFASALKHDLMRLALWVSRKQQTLPSAARHLSRLYGWIPFGYDGPTIWDEHYFTELLNKELKHGPSKLEHRLNEFEMDLRNSAKLLKQDERRYVHTKAQKRHLEILRRLAEWTDDRKRIEYQIHIHYHGLMIAFSKQTKIPLPVIKNLLNDEFPLVLTDPGQARRIGVARLKRKFVVAFKNGRPKIIPDAQCRKIIAVVTKVSSAKELHGDVASVGPKTKYQGIARVLNSPSECGKVKPGDFIVTQMTTPQFVSAMYRAAGFLTDEGGVTCHAAIMAREMNKPCIIGLKNATRVLRDGDKIEIDVIKGLVKKLSV